MYVFEGRSLYMNAEQIGLFLNISMHCGKKRGGGKCIFSNACLKQAFK